MLPLVPPNRPQLSLPPDRPASPNPVYRRIGPASPNPVYRRIGPASPSPVYRRIGPASPSPVYRRIGPTSPSPVYLRIGPASPSPVYLRIGPASPSPVYRWIGPASPSSFTPACCWHNCANRHTASQSDCSRCFMLIVTVFYYIGRNRHIFKSLNLAASNLEGIFNIISDT